MIKEELTKILLSVGFKKKNQNNLTRKINDVIQLVNFQKSLYSDNIYVNFAVWPLILGEPNNYKEYLFPIVGRIDDIVEIGGADNHDLLTRFVNSIDDGFSSFVNIKSLYLSGALKRISVKLKVKSIMEEKND